MRSIFFRIYSGMLLATIIIVGASYAAFQWMSEYRLHRYIDQVATGTFTLIAQGIARHQGEKRQDWVDVLTRLTGLNLMLSESPPEALSGAQLNSIVQGEIVINPDADNKVASLYMAVPGESKLYLSTDLQDINEQLSRVTALLILNELGRHTKESRPQELISIREKFGFPVSLPLLSNISLDFAQQRRVKRGDVLVILNDTTSDQPFIQVIAKYGNSGRVLSLGPIPLFNWFPVNIILILGGSGLVLLAVSSYLLVRPLERRLQHMEVEVEKIGTELAPTVTVEGDDAVGRLAKKVNLMAQRIQALLDEQRELIHSVSHELRTPVSRLKFRLESLGNTADETKRQEAVSGIEKDLNVLNSLIDEILTFASLENRPDNLKQAAVDIDQMFNQLKDEISPLYPDIALILELPTKDPSATGIDYLLQRAVQNLLLNCMRYAHSKINLHFSSNEQCHQIRVSDDGPGVMAEDRERVFMPFTRVDKSRNRASGGFGLGLAIVRQVAYWHGGTVSIENSVMGGAEFVLQWPRVAP